MQMMTWLMTTFSLSSLKNKIVHIPGLEYLYKRIPADQLDLPGFVLQQDVNVSRFLLQFITRSYPEIVYFCSNLGLDITLRSKITPLDRCDVREGCDSTFQRQVWFKLGSISKCIYTVDHVQNCGFEVNCCMVERGFEVHKVFVLVYCDVSKLCVVVF